MKSSFYLSWSSCNCDDFTGEAESGLERLHQCAEKELQQFLNADSKPSADFNDFRTKLAGLTRYILCTNIGESDIYFNSHF